MGKNIFVCERDKGFLFNPLKDHVKRNIFHINKNKWGPDERSASDFAFNSYYSLLAPLLLWNAMVQCPSFFKCIVWGFWEDWEWGWNVEDSEIRHAMIPAIGPTAAGVSAMLNSSLYLGGLLRSVPIQMPPIPLTLSPVHPCARLPSLSVTPLWAFPHRNWCPNGRRGGLGWWWSLLTQGPHTRLDLS